jgi:hypothetical protein
MGRFRATAFAAGVAALTATGGCAGVSGQQKGFVAVADLRADAVLVLKDGRTLPFAEAFPEFRRRAIGHPLPVHEIALAGMLDEFRAFLAPFDRYPDGIIEKPEIALLYMWIAASNKGHDLAGVSVAGGVVNGLAVDHGDEYGLEALPRETPATTAEASRLRDRLRNLEHHLDPQTGGGSVLGGLGQPNRDLE